jgi:hypothetical protein
MVAVTKNKKGDEIFKIFISETTGPNGTNLCLYSPLMTPFQNCVRQSRSLVLSGQVVSEENIF